MDFHQLENNSRGRKFIQECFLFRDTQKHIWLPLNQRHVSEAFIFLHKRKVLEICTYSCYSLLSVVTWLQHSILIPHHGMKREIVVSINHLKPRSDSFSHKVKFPFVVHGTCLKPHPPLDVSKWPVLRIQGHLNTQKQSGEEVLP